jgi:hypothetical protein
MKTRLFPFCRLSVLPAMLFCVSGTAITVAMNAETSTAFAAPAATAVPAAPIPAKYIAFSDKVAGRRLLFAARDAYRNAPGLRMSAQWTLVDPGGRTTAGTETIVAQSGQGKLALTSETNGAVKTVRRAIANGMSSGGSLLVTQYKAAAPNPVRQFSRYPLDETTPLSRSLQLAGFSPVTMGGDLLLAPDWRLQTAALVYVSRSDSLAGSTAVIQTDLPAGGNQAQTKVTRRYLVDSKTNRLRRYEEWRTTQGRPRTATKKQPADNGLQTSYRREDYTEATAPITAAAFSQALPVHYTEQAATAVKLPPVPKELSTDPRVIDLIRKWRAAHERFLTLNAVVDIRTDVQQRTEISRPVRNDWGRSAALYTFWRMRPGQARIVVNEIDPATQQPKTTADSVAVADGQRIRINDYANGRTDTDRQRDPAVVPFDRLRRVLRQSWNSGVVWVLDGPPSAEEFSDIKLDTSSGTPALLFSRTYDTNNRGRKAETRATWRVTLGPDNLPREILSQQVTDISGAFERDQPPTSTTAVRVRSLSVDAEPLPETFVLPQEIARR